MDKLSDSSVNFTVLREEILSDCTLLPQEDVDVLKITWKCYKASGNFLLCMHLVLFLISSVQNAYRDTYRIVTPVSRYVSYHEVTISFHPYSIFSVAL